MVRPTFVDRYHDLVVGSRAGGIQEALGSGMAAETNDDKAGPVREATAIRDVDGGHAPFGVEDERGRDHKRWVESRRHLFIHAARRVRLSSRRGRSLLKSESVPWCHPLIESMSAVIVGAWFAQISL